MFELGKQFRFEAAHTLMRSIDSESSRRIHGHSYRAEVIIKGPANPDTGMVIDLGEVDIVLMQIRSSLDHQFLDDIKDLGPATLENISAWIWRRLAPACPGLSRVSVYRDSSGDACSYYGPQEKP